MEFRLLVRGDRACFRRPEFVADLVSYDVITPVAARGILEAIHIAPDMAWRIDEIRVLSAVRSTWMALSEVSAVDPGGALPVALTGPADRRIASVLSDVAYLLTVGIEGRGGASDVSRHEAAFRRQVASGRFRRPLFLGLRGFAAEVTLLEPEAPMPDGALADRGAIDLGWMPFDRAGGSGGSLFFRAIMIGGVIGLRHRDALILAG